MKFKKKVVYKVVDIVGRKLLSAYAPKETRQSYCIGKTTLPVKGTKLFVFTKFKDAKEYAGFGKVIYKALATNIEHNGWLDYDIHDIKQLRYMFATHESMSPSVFTSCAVCDSVKLIKRIYP
jgi:hypothetical protein